MITEAKFGVTGMLAKDQGYGLNLETEKVRKSFSLSQSVWAAITKDHDGVCGLNNRHLFLPILETGSPRSKPAVSISGERSHPGLWMADISQPYDILI